MRDIFILWGICVVVPLVAWGIAELRGSKKPRLISAGVLVAANLVFALIAFLSATAGTRMEYNMWYSDAADQLVESIVTELEKGRVDEVVVELKRLDEQFLPDYQERGRWDELVKETVARLSGRDEGPSNEPG